jgi:hypothetical protein
MRFGLRMDGAAQSFDASLFRSDFRSVKVKCISLDYSMDLRWKGRPLDMIAGIFSQTMPETNRGISGSRICAVLEDAHLFESDDPSLTRSPRRREARRYSG